MRKYDRERHSPPDRGQSDINDGKLRRDVMYVRMRWPRLWELSDIHVLYGMGHRYHAGTDGDEGEEHAKFWMEHNSRINRET